MSSAEQNLEGLGISLAANGALFVVAVLESVVEFALGAKHQVLASLNHHLLLVLEANDAQQLLRNLAVMLVLLFLLRWECRLFLGRGLRALRVEGFRCQLLKLVDPDLLRVLFAIHDFAFHHFDLVHLLVLARCGVEGQLLL